MKNIVCIKPVAAIGAVTAAVAKSNTAVASRTVAGTAATHLLVAKQKLLQ